MVESRPERTFYQNVCLQTNGDIGTGQEVEEDDAVGARILSEADDDAAVDQDVSPDYEDDIGGESDSGSDGGRGMDDPDDEVEDDENIPKPSDRGISLCAKVSRTTKKHKRRKKLILPNNKPTKVYAGDKLDVHKDIEECIVDGRIMYKCPCGKQYRKLDTMENHFKLVHTGLKGTFVCTVCKSDFYYQGALNAHVKRKFCHRNWNKKSPRPHSKPACEPPYEGGPRMDFSELQPAEIFVWLLRTVLPIWIKHTDYYGREKFRSRQKKEPWKEFTMPKALIWIGLYLSRGVLKLHRIRSPWRGHGLFGHKFFMSHMSGCTWYQILKASSFSNREEEIKPGGRGEINGPNFNKLWRLIDIINAFTECAQSAFNPFKELCIDEMMTKFLGWFQWKQTIPHKPVKCGIKSFVLTDARTGYILGFIPAVKQGFRTFSQFGATASAVWALLTSELAVKGRNFLHNGHFLFTDSYYTMFSLIEHLYTCCTYYCGTISKARQLPPGFVDKFLDDGEPMERGDSKHTHTDIITLTHWIDNGSVRIASSLPNVVEEASEVTRKVKNDDGKWTNETIPCPQIVREYNKYMGGVDLADQLLAATHVHIRQVRWYITIWFRILEMAMLNAYIIYQKTFPDSRFSKDRLAFHVNVIEGLMSMAKDLDATDDPTHSDVQGDNGPPQNLSNLKIDTILTSRKRLNKREHHFPTLVSRGSCVVHGCWFDCGRRDNEARKLEFDGKLAEQSRSDNDAVIGGIGEHASCGEEQCLGAEIEQDEPVVGGNGYDGSPEEQEKPHVEVKVKPEELSVTSFGNSVIEDGLEGVPFEMQGNRLPGTATAGMTGADSAMTNGNNDPFHGIWNYGDQEFDRFHEYTVITGACAIMGVECTCQTSEGALFGGIMDNSSCLIHRLDA